MHLGLQCFAMRAFEVSLNGKKLCVAGVGDDGVLVANADWVGKPGDEELFLAVSGLNNSREHIDWIVQKPLNVGDEVQIRIVEAAEVDEPASRHQAQVPRARHIGGIIGPY
ncbi:MAG TPA: hypothetical protein VFA90_05485 [Terriglobales bacterium]|nr:hypothetical protein [Terriglobales bacterium]